MQTLLSEISEEISRAEDVALVGVDDAIAADALRRYPLLSHAETLRLARMKEALSDPDASAEERRRGQEAFDLLVASNLRLVLSVVKRRRGCGLSEADLFQEGVVGLMTAVRKFDPALGFKFSTYATNWIIAACQRAAHAQVPPVKLTHARYDEIQRCRRKQAELAQCLAREPSTEELAEALGVTAREASDLLRDMLPPLSLSAELRTSSDELLEVVHEGTSADPAEICAAEWSTSALAESLGDLTSLERRVIRARFGLDNGATSTLQEIAVALGIERSTVRLIEGRALQKLAEDPRLIALKDFV